MPDFNARPLCYSPDAVAEAFADGKATHLGSGAYRCDNIVVKFRSNNFEEHAEKEVLNDALLRAFGVQTPGYRLHPVTDEIQQAFLKNGGYDLSDCKMVVGHYIPGPSALELEADELATLRAYAHRHLLIPYMVLGMNDSSRENMIVCDDILVPIDLEGSFPEADILNFFDIYAFYDHYMMFYGKPEQHDFGHYVRQCDFILDRLQDNTVRTVVEDFKSGLSECFVERTHKLKAYLATEATPRHQPRWNTAAPE